MCYQKKEENPLFVTGMINACNDRQPSWKTIFIKLAFSFIKLLTEAIFHPLLGSVQYHNDSTVNRGVQKLGSITWGYISLDLFIQYIITDELCIYQLKCVTVISIYNSWQILK